MNATLAEQPNGDFGHTIVRQFLLDAWQLELYERLTASSDERLAQIAAKALKETRYHLRFSSGWLVRLGDGTEREPCPRAGGARFAVALTRASCSVPMRPIREIAGAGHRPGSGRPRAGLVRARRCGPQGGDTGRPAGPALSLARQARRAYRASVGTCWRRCSSCSAPTRARAGSHGLIRRSACQRPAARGGACGRCLRRYPIRRSRC